MLEIQLGELAQKNAASDKVKEFGQMMINDHTKSNEELKKLAFDKKIALPAKLGEESLKKYNDFNAKKGYEFDKDYIEYMVKNHKEDIQSFKDEAANGKDSEIKFWAEGKIPTLEHHLQMAQETQQWVKK